MIIISASYYRIFQKHHTHPDDFPLDGLWKIYLLDSKRTFLSQTSMTSEDYGSSPDAAAK